MKKENNDRLPTERRRFAEETRTLPSRKIIFGPENLTEQSVIYGNAAEASFRNQKDTYKLSQNTLKRQSVSSNARNRLTDYPFPVRTNAEAWMTNPSAPNLINLWGI